MSKKNKNGSKAPDDRTVKIEIEDGTEETGSVNVDEKVEEAADPEGAGEEKTNRNDNAPEQETTEEAKASEQEMQEGADAPEEGAQDRADASEKSGGEGFFSQEKKDPKEEKIAELTDRLQRQMAEFENYRKRTEKEKSTMYDMGARDVVEKLLPIVDNFERGLEGADEKDPFVEGMAMIYKQFMTMLAEIGVEPIEAARKEFDPNLHNAVMHIDDEQYEENIVAEELQKGYKYKDQVIRYSMVKVAN